MKRNLLTIALFSILAILPVSIFAQQNPFPGCNFVLEDAACKSFFGLSEGKAEAVVKAADYTGQYHNYGIHVYYSSTLKSVTFYGTKPHSEYRNSFDGKPSKNFNWGDSADSVISKFRQPDSQKTWKTGDNSLIDFYYGENTVLEFKSGKLVSVTFKSRATDLGITAPTSTSNGGSEAQQNIVATDSKLKNAFADCQFIIEDAGCRKFYGKSGVELNSIFGEMPKNGSYSNLGIWFYMWSPSREKAETVGEVKFYGRNIGDGNRFSGKPGKNLDWNASPSDVIKIYGKPASQTEWTNSDKTVESAMGYGGDLSMRFENEKLVEITLTNPKYIEESDAYLEKEKQKYLEEKKTAETRIVQENAKETAKNEANQMEADYKSLLNQLDTKLEEGNRIIRTEMTAIAAGGMFKNAVQKKLDRVRDAGDSLIDQFSKKYQGMIPAWMVKGIQEKWRPIPVPN